MSNKPSEYRLSTQGLTKHYPGTIACQDIDLTIQPGEIHALLGENGAGKSTLVKMIYGVTAPTRGQIFWEGRPVVLRSPAMARELGIGMVFQDFALFESLRVVENVALALPKREPHRVLAKRIQTVSERYGLPIDPEKPVGSLSVGERQRVEIVRSLLQTPRLLIMDEPTSVLAPQAVERLFETLRQIAAEGCSVLYISHKLHEIRALCDRATVLRQGRVTGTCTPANETAGNLARMMIGQALPVVNRPPSKVADVALAVNTPRISSGDEHEVGLEALSFSVSRGEILGIAGISGNGQGELLRLLSGERLAPSADAIRINGEPVGQYGVAKRRERGMAYIPEDRRGQATVADLPLTDNATLTAINTQPITQYGLMRHAAIQAFTQRCIEIYQVVCSGSQAPARSLSGGNLQKFVVGRELLQMPQLLVCAQPTWGVDVGAAAFIRQKLLDLRSEQTAIVVISEEIEELFEISDRIAVIADGRLSPIRSVADSSYEQVGLWMSGLWDSEGALNA